MPSWGSRDFAAEQVGDEILRFLGDREWQLRAVRWREEDRSGAVLTALAFEISEASEGRGWRLQ